MLVHNWMDEINECDNFDSILKNKHPSKITVWSLSFSLKEDGDPEHADGGWYSLQELFHSKDDALKAANETHESGYIYKLLKVEIESENKYDRKVRLQSEQFVDIDGNEVQVKNDSGVKLNTSELQYSLDKE